MNCTHTARGPAERIDVGEPHPAQHDCTATIAALVDVAVRSSLALTTAALNCCVPQKPCAPAGDCGCGRGDANSTEAEPSAAKRTVHSEFFPTTGIGTQRQLTLETPLSTGYMFIPPERITLRPSAGRDSKQHPLGVLGPTEVTFQIEIDATGLPGAVYFGIVRVRSADGSVDEPVPVTIEL